jgi:hypothetical protein
MAGSATVRRLRQEACNVLIAERSELDLPRQDQTERYLSVTRPNVVTMAAGRVGGILANDTTRRIFSPRISPWSSIAPIQPSRCAVPECLGISHANPTFRESLWDRFLPAARLITNDMEKGSNNMRFGRRSEPGAITLHKVQLFA